MSQHLKPTAIGPYEWPVAGGPTGERGFISVPIWHSHPAAYYTHTFRLLAGYVFAPDTARIIRND